MDSNQRPLDPEPRATYQYEKMVKERGKEERGKEREGVAEWP